MKVGLMFEKGTVEGALQERAPELTYLKVPNRRFAPLRHDGRYEQLVRRVGLTV